MISLLAPLCAAAQLHRLYIERVAYNSTTNTVDFYAKASKDGKSFSDFDLASLSASETIGGKSYSLPIIYFEFVEDSTDLGNEQLIQIFTQSQQNPHRETRTYELVWKENKKNVATARYEQQWTDANSFDLASTYSFLDLLFIGLSICAGLLLIISEGIPLARKLLFEFRYVKPYYLIRREGETNLNPITGQPLKPTDKVVVMCNHHYLYEQWVRNDYQCPSPEQCNGHVNLGFRQFFQQRGPFRQLNWLWFGALGGLFAWLIAYGLNTAFPDAAGWLKASFLGLGLGAGLTFMLAWVEERGQGAELSWSRVALRTTIGTAASWVIFAAGYFFQKQIGLDGLASALIWIIFSLSLGAILSIRSTIILRRGLLSGLAAGLVSSLLYGLSISLFRETDLARLISFIGLGAVMGWGIMEVVKQLQNIRLEVLQPRTHREWSFDLDSALLTQGKNKGRAIIGKDKKKCTVYTKWEDEHIMACHAEISYRNNRVSIRRMEGRVSVNDKLLNDDNPVLLKGGERIEIGSKTVFKYVQKNG